MNSAASTINVAAVVIRNAAGEVLCVRKATSPRFQLPGGKPEPGESMVDAAIRETREEIGVNVPRESLSFLGRFSAEASNEPGHTVTSAVFTSSVVPTDPAPAAEIAEIAWIDPSDPQGHELAPLLATRIFPALAPRDIGAVAVFAGARPSSDTTTSQLAFEFGAALAEAGITLVYGGSKLGMMGEVARGASSSNGSLVGVLTTHLANYELKFDELDRLEVVGTMAERKALMSQLADAFVVLPGGVGTLDELFDEWTSQQLGIHSKPIGLLGVEFWTPFLTMVDHMVEHGFVRATDREHLIVADEPGELLAALRAWVPPVPRWI
ncbi:LOG family protein YvdD [Corynebacterium glaucum]|uniref:LOG family protein YvdD n=1 Tax=Corynebacterium glaucum TaxID=187491 RepID=A0A1Q2HZJ3_9CORY|nr:TIGR00730 family Rossman fold protein [Corynebacterium glaucum]AQQ16285.1 LOG family protein YvdD [Corynebacterium glaucum]